LTIVDKLYLIITFSLRLQMNVIKTYLEQFRFNLEHFPLIGILALVDRVRDGNN
jgi:hypothetical protein